MFWMEDQPSHNRPLRQSLTQSKALALFSSVKAERDGKAKGEKSEASRGGFMWVKPERSCLHNTKVQGEAAGADGEDGASSPGDLSLIIHDGAILDNSFSV